MKKYLVIMLFAACMAAFVGCKKEDASNPLNGTVWKFTEFDNEGGRWEQTLNFQKSTFSLMVEYPPSPLTEAYSYTLTGTYNYSSPYVTLQVPIDGFPDESPDEGIGIISGDTMTFETFLDEIGTYVFIKQ